MNVFDPASRVKMLCVEVKLAAVTVASCSPSSVLETPNRLYAWPLTRAMTDQVKSFPYQNFGDPVGKLAAKSPGSQTTPVSHGYTIIEHKLMHELDKYGLRTARGYAGGRRGEKVAAWTRCSRARPSMAPAVERKLNPISRNRNGAGKEEIKGLRSRIYMIGMVDVQIPV